MAIGYGMRLVTGSVGALREVVLLPPGVIRSAKHPNNGSCEPLLTERGIASKPRPKRPTMNSTQAYPAVHGDILLLEDDTAFAPLLREVLSMAGYDVRLARSAPEALAHIEVGSLAAAVLDWRLLGDSAEEVADRLQSARVPYVFASGASATAVPERHRWAPFFAKPFRITALINALEEARAAGVPARA